MSTWRRKGLVLSPPNGHAWWKNCAGVPTCLPLGKHLWRIWFGGRDAQGRTGILCVDVDPENDMKILALRDTPGLERGTGGSFDSAGIWPSAVLHENGKVMLWYTGMCLSQAVPHELAIGLAISDDKGLTFRKVSNQAVLTAGPEGEQFVTTPSVQRGTTGFEMWFSHGIGWRSVNGTLNPWYDIRHASSPDGINWTIDTVPVLSLDQTSWAGLTRPWVTTFNGARTLWFSARGGRDFRDTSTDAYRLFYTPLVDGMAARDSITPLAFAPPPRPDDWDSWMQVAPCILPFRDTRIMLYNGNDFSRTGFGYAIEENAPQLIAKPT